MNFLLTYTINRMTAEDKKLAEKIIKRELDYLKIVNSIQDSRYTTLPNYQLVRAGTRIMYDNMYGCIMESMEAYHQAKLAEVTDEDIETWAENFVKNPEHYFHSVKDLIIGAKAFQKGEIKHIDNQ